MASSTAATTPWLPTKGTHSVTIGSSMRRSLTNSRLSPPHAAQPAHGDFVAMRYNFKPKNVVNATGSLKPSGEYAQKESFQMELGAETGEREAFSVQPQKQKEVDCVLFYDPFTKTLVLERLDSVLAVKHQPRNNDKSAPLNGHAHQQPTAFPPTPPSLSPPEYSALPEASRPKHGETRPTRAKTDGGASSDLPNDHTPEIQPSSRSASISTPGSATSSLKAPRSMSDYAQEQRKLQEARPHMQKRSASDFASEPDEEILDFGKPSVSTASSNNALRLSDMPIRRAKRKIGSDSEPDEEELEFGRPSKEIKRPKTASLSPASVSYGTPIMGASQSELAPSPRHHAQQSTLPASPVPSPSYVPPGPSPLATAPVISVDSGSEDEDDDSSDSEAEAEPPTFTPSRTNQPIEVDYAYGATDGDGEEDDFLAAAFNNPDDTMAVQGDANHSDDSSDESDYNER